MTTIRIKKYLAERVKSEYQDESYNTIIDTILIELALAKKYKPKFVRIKPQLHIPVGEDLNVKIQESLLEELYKEFPNITMNEIVYTLLTPEEEEYRAIEYPSEIYKDFPGKSMYEAGLILRNNTRY